MVRFFYSILIKQSTIHEPHISEENAEKLSDNKKKLEKCRQLRRSGIILKWGDIPYLREAQRKALSSCLK